MWKTMHVMENCGIDLTESLAMVPAASVCGLYFAHPQSLYFSVGKICHDQVKNYTIIQTPFIILRRLMHTKYKIEKLSKLIAQ